MKKNKFATGICCGLLCTSLFALGGCESTEKAEEARTEAPRPRTLTEEATGAKYSASTLILSLVRGTDEDQIRSLAKRYDLGVVYVMTNLSMCTLRLPSPATAEEMQALIDELESYDFVLMAHRDYIMRLDSKQ